jgi:hypothetical protein
MHLLPILHQHAPSSAPSVTRTRILALRQETLAEQLDWLATEEPCPARDRGHPDGESGGRAGSL